MFNWYPDLFDFWCLKSLVNQGYLYKILIDTSIPAFSWALYTNSVTLIFFLTNSSAYSAGPGKNTLLWNNAEPLHLWMPYLQIGLNNFEWIWLIGIRDLSHFGIFTLYNTSQEMCSQFVLCCVLIWFVTCGFIHSFMVSKIRKNIYRSDIQVTYELNGHFRFLQVLYSK